MRTDRDELETNDIAIDSSENFSSSDAQFGDYGHSSTESSDQDYSLGLEDAASLSEAGTDSAVCYSDTLEYASDGGDTWDYSGFGNDDSIAGDGENNHSSDMDLYQVYDSDSDLGEADTLNYQTDAFNSGDSSVNANGNSIFFYGSDADFSDPKLGKAVTDGFSIVRVNLSTRRDTLLVQRAITVEYTALIPLP